MTVLSYLFSNLFTLLVQYQFLKEINFTREVFQKEQAAPPMTRNQVLLTILNFNSINK
jgi:hypothetical protein